MSFLDVASLVGAAVAGGAAALLVVKLKGKAPPDGSRLRGK